MFTLLECLAIAAVLSAFAAYQGMRYGFKRGALFGEAKGVRDILVMQAMGLQPAIIDGKLECQCKDCVAGRQKEKAGG